MARLEVPLLRESEVFSARLYSAARVFGQPLYHFRRRVNWSHRYEEMFYDSEVSIYLNDPEGYLSGDIAVKSELGDVYGKKVGSVLLGTVLMKVLAHWVFNALGRINDHRVMDRRPSTYRKCYVDDIELVFDQHEDSVIRAVFPFPLNAMRQVRYIRNLRRRRMPFKLDGNPYLPADLLRFLAKRDIRSLMRMEARAQIRHALAVAKLGVSRVQLSDEFDIGSLDFSRGLGRCSIRVVNSAHGVGKYLPVHCYQEFHVLTHRQERYYFSVRQCKYAIRRLNDTSTTEIGRDATAGNARGERILLVVLSQKFDESPGVIRDNESVLLELLREEIGGMEGVVLYYKPHPNRGSIDAVAGFNLVSDLREVNGSTGTIFVSFFSTCQIDPAFKGRKFLIKGRYIHPEIAFDETEPILSMAELVEKIKAEASELRGCSSAIFPAGQVV